MAETIRGTTSAVVCVMSLVMAVVGMAYADSHTLATNLYARALAVYDAESVEHGGDRERAYKAISGGCFCDEVNMTNFMPFCSFVSNRWNEVLADWHTYETNDMVRYITLCGLGYSGFANYTNFLSQTLARYDSDTNYCAWGTIKHLQCLHGTRAQYYLNMNYEDPGVESIVRTIKRLAVNVGDSETSKYCDDILSGESKRFCLDMIAIGDWIQ